MVERLAKWATDNTGSSAVDGEDDWWKVSALGKDILRRTHDDTPRVEDGWVRRWARGDVGGGMVDEEAMFKVEEPKSRWQNWEKRVGCPMVARPGQSGVSGLWLRTWSIWLFSRSLFPNASDNVEILLKCWCCTHRWCGDSVQIAGIVFVLFSWINGRQWLVRCLWSRHSGNVLWTLPASGTCGVCTILLEVVDEIKVVQKVDVFWTIVLLMVEDLVELDDREKRVDDD